MIDSALSPADQRGQAARDDQPRTDRCAALDIARTTLPVRRRRLEEIRLTIPAGCNPANHSQEKSPCEWEQMARENDLREGMAREREWREKKTLDSDGGRVQRLVARWRFLARHSRFAAVLYRR